MPCQDMQRSNSGRECNTEKAYRKLSCMKGEWSWSWNLSPTYEKSRKSTLMITKKNHQRLKNMETMAFKGCDEPKLVRSSGMRRDWNFEDLKTSGEDRKM